MKRTQSYKDLEVYSLAKKLAVKIHKLTLEPVSKPLEAVILSHGSGEESRF